MCTLAVFAWRWRWNARTTPTRGSPAERCERPPRGRGRARGREARLAELFREAAEAGAVHHCASGCATIYPHRHRCAPPYGAGAVPAEQSRQHLDQQRWTCRRGRARGRGHLQKGDLLGRTASSGRRDCRRRDCRRRDLAAGVRRRPPVLADAREEGGRDSGAAGFRSRSSSEVGRLHANSP
jgi:hypothetical protein